MKEITSKDLTQWLFERANFDPKAGINRNDTLLLLDCRGLKSSKCKSLLVDRHHGVISSPKETKRLLNEWFKQQTIGLLLLRAMQKLILQKDRVQSLAIVHGNAMFVPLSGATQHSTSWVAMHNLASQVYFPADRQTLRLNFKENKLDLPLIEVKANQSVFKKQYQIAQKMMLLQYQLAHCLAAEFRIEEDSFLFRRCLESVHEFNCYHPQKFLELYHLELLDSFSKECWDEKLSNEQLIRRYKEVTSKYDLF
jgi:hypothetical protein